MKKLSMMFLLAAVMMGAAAPQARAELDVYAGANAGFLVPNQDNIKAGFIGGGEVGFSKDFWGVDLSMLYCSAEVKAIDGDSSGLPKVGILPISITPFLQYKIEKSPLFNLPLTLKAGGGLTYGLISYDYTSNVTKGTSKSYFNQSVDSVLGYNLKGGLDVKVSEHFSVGADMVYLILQPELTTKSESTTSSSFSRSSSKGHLDLNSIVMTAAVKYHF